MVYFWGSKIKLDVFEAVYGFDRFDADDPELFMAHGDSSRRDPAIQRFIKQKQTLACALALVYVLVASYSFSTQEVFTALSKSRRPQPS